MKYKVLQYFQWGRLKLEKGQSIDIEHIDHKTAEIRTSHNPTQIQPINQRAIETMIQLGKIAQF